LQLTSDVVWLGLLHGSLFNNDLSAVQVILHCMRWKNDDRWAERDL